jgi:hypothetical protein
MAYRCALKGGAIETKRRILGCCSGQNSVARSGSIIERVPDKKKAAARRWSTAWVLLHGVHKRSPPGGCCRFMRRRLPIVPAPSRVAGRAYYTLRASVSCGASGQRSNLTASVSEKATAKVRMRRWLISERAALQPMVELPRELPPASCRSREANAAVAKITYAGFLQEASRPSDVSEQRLQILTGASIAL